MVNSGYRISHVADVPVIRMAEIDEVEAKFDRLGVQNLDEVELGTEEMKVKIWHIPPGETMGPHGHETQEEFYYVLEGEFRVRIGPPGGTDTHEVGPGAIFAASPRMARGYENIGDSNGRVLVVAAPNVSEGGYSGTRDGRVRGCLYERLHRASSDTTMPHTPRVRSSYFLSISEQRTRR